MFYLQRERRDSDPQSTDRQSVALTNYATHEEPIPLTTLKCKIAVGFSGHF